MNNREQILDFIKANPGLSSSDISEKAGVDAVDSIDYKKAILIFYEQNNLYAFKQIFIDQEEFAVKTYF